MFKEILKSKWFTVAALILIGFLVTSVIKTTPLVLTAVKEVENLDRKIADVKKTDSELQKLGDYLKSDAYLEQQARLKLNYKKPDENVVFVYKNIYNQNPTENPNSQSIASRVLELTAKPFKSLQSWLGNLIKNNAK